MLERHRSRQAPDHQLADRVSQRTRLLRGRQGVVNIVNDLALALSRSPFVDRGALAGIVSQFAMHFCQEDGTPVVDQEQ